MKTVGIIGFGSFGKFLAEKLSSHAKVVVYSARGVQSSWAAPLEEVAKADYLIPAIPLDSYETVLSAFKPHLGENTVLVDVCSVKATPAKVLTSLFPNHSIVVTHPMFGPESASVSLAGHTVVMCPEVSTVAPYAQVKQFVESVGLSVIEMSADEHDKEIATVQGLTFFVARVLNEAGIHDAKLSTPSFQRLLSLAELEKHHSIELFKTIQQGNAHTTAVRETFLTTAQKIADDLQ